jgi:hypothetical protein
MNPMWFIMCKGGNPMNSKKSSSSAPFAGIGSAPLLVVFLVLCLLTFAALSLSTARSNDRFSQKVADRKNDYITACNESQLLLSRLDDFLWTQYKMMPEQDSSKLPALVEAFSWGEIDPDIEWKDNTCQVSWQTPINDQQTLEITIALINEEDRQNNPDSGLYEIREWKVIQTESWESTESITLLPIE